MIYIYISHCFLPKPKGSCRNMCFKEALFLLHHQQNTVPDNVFLYRLQYCASVEKGIYCEKYLVKLQGFVPALPRSKH